jgi:hypothetical protein
MNRPHKGLRRQVALVAAIILMILAMSSCGKSERPVRIFGFSSQGPNFGVDAAQQAAHSLERKLDVVNIFIAWEWKRPLPIGTLQRIHELGALPAITWEPWHPAHGANQPQYALERITAGAFDGYIMQWARAAASFGQPMQIRFGHEMNGTWYPWSIGVNGNSANDYRNAYRHVHDMFIAAGAAQVQWVWSIFGEQAASGTEERSRLLSRRSVRRRRRHRRLQRRADGCDVGFTGGPVRRGDRRRHVGCPGEAGMDLRDRFGRRARRQSAMDHRSICVFGTD